MTDLKKKKAYGVINTKIIKYYCGGAEALDVDSVCVGGGDMGLAGRGLKSSLPEYIDPWTSMSGRLINPLGRL